MKSMLGLFALACDGAGMTGEHAQTYSVASRMDVAICRA